MTFGKMFGSLRQRRTLALTGLVGLMSTTTLGCDTVALISFQERAFNTLESFGVTPMPGSCDGSDGSAMLRFVLIADDNSPIRPDEVVANEPVNVTRDSLSLGDGKLFELPDLQCSADSCAFSEFSCAAADPAYEAAKNRCLRDAAIDIDGAVQFDADVTKDQAFGLLIENAGSLDGWLPSDVGAKYPDYDGDGNADGTNDVSLKSQRATDRSGNRKVAFNSLTTRWARAAELASKDDRKTYFGAWQFSGTSTAGVLSLVAQATPTEQIWTEQPGNATNSIDKLSPTKQERANVYQAMADVLETAYTSDPVANAEKTLVVFVDGPDDLRIDAYDLDRVITAAQDSGTRLFVVHLDPAIATEDIGGTPYLRDDPRYVEDQSPCTSDADCRNYEECRQPVNYSSVANGPVENALSDTYCLPTRDDNGRIGPIQDYQRLACETEGAYIYVPSSLALRNRMQYLPFAMDGLWKVETVVDQFQNGSVPANEPYKVQADFSVNLGQRSRTFTFSQTGDPLVGPKDDDQDTRTVIFSK